MTFDSAHDAASHLAHLAHKKKMVVARASCAKGLYLAPSANTTVDSSKPMTITWDTSCFNPAPTAIDIYMTAPLNADPNIHSWTNIDYAKGTVDIDLKPKWWNSTSSISMQLNIVETGTPSGLTKFPAAPLFSITYDPSTAATNTQVAAAANTDIPDSPYTSVNNVYHNGGLSKGALAAAILIPLLVVIGALGVYVKISRDKESKKRQRWSQAVDNRMSHISGDWKAITPPIAVIRQSMALSGGDRGTKASSFFAGYGPSPARPSSTFSHGESGQAGLGARYGGTGLGGAIAAADGAEDAPIRRPAPTSAADPSARVSRVSFAADTRAPRPSMGDSLRTSVYTNGTSRASRAYHRGTVYDDDEDVPPVPSRLDEMQLSPTQTDGPAPLTPQEIRAKIGADATAPRPSVDDWMNMPAVSLIRTQEGSNEMVLTPAPPAPVVTYPAVPAPAPVAASPSAVPVQSNFGMATLHDAPAGAMSSPDDMLKAYAISKKKSLSNPKRGNTIETTTSANGGMRTLYAPPEESPYEEDAYGGYAMSYYGNNSHGHTDSYAGTISEEAVVASATRRVPPGEDNNPFRKSMAVSRAFTEASRYSGYDGEARGEAR
ncbi:hypothetical protein M407DRAFT_23826 [Tulasnella calospora MUT 4182]|uniref:Uncharacterized protein n=1 Tax=Tulasnella calospora MUT 4182 TaxID=1051891 RepID=A0A0C3QIV6_9AGAM|nr:hypothetical protein M407DRAFT_23826 [Tulasnella calospora MUT 4182]